MRRRRSAATSGKIGNINSKTALPQKEHGDKEMPAAPCAKRLKATVNYGTFRIKTDMIEKLDTNLRAWLEEQGFKYRGTGFAKFVREMLIKENILDRDDF